MLETHRTSAHDAETLHRSASVALVRPPLLQIIKSLSFYGAVPPIGLAYVAAALREAGHRVQVVDAAGEALDRFARMPGQASLYRYGLSPGEVVTRLAEDTQIIGISHMFLHEWPTVREIAEAARERFPQAVVVLGGENATAYHRQIFSECAAVDYCVLGEGEATIVELASRLARGEGLEGLAGLASRAGAGPTRRRATRLEEIPRPAWDLFPLESYLTHADNFGVHRGRSIPMIATRGCPYQCTFCSSPQMWTTRYVTRPPREVVDEIAAYVEQYAVTNVDFCDLTALVKRDWILEFCRLLEASGLKITWQLPVGTRSEALDEEVLRALHATGCCNVTYAPESGSDRMLKVIKKKVKLPHLLASLTAADRIGLTTRVNIIIGHPEERWPDLWDTFKFLLRIAWLGCQDASVMIFAPYPGSEDFERLVAEGMMQRPVDDYYLALARAGRSAKTYNRHISRRALLAVQLGMLLAFHVIAYLTRPWRWITLIQNLLSGREESQVAQLLRTKWRQIVRIVMGGRAGKASVRSKPG